MKKNNKKDYVTESHFWKKCFSNLQYQLDFEWLITNNKSLIW